MKLDVTRDVVTDLWTLSRAGDATADSRALVDAFLAEDRVFAHTLQASETLTSVMPRVQLSADAERRLLDETRDRARMKLMVIGAAVAIAGAVLMAAFAGVLLLTFRAG